MPAKGCISHTTHYTHLATHSSSLTFVLGSTPKTMLASHYMYMKDAEHDHRLVLSVSKCFEAPDPQVLPWGG